MMSKFVPIRVFNVGKEKQNAYETTKEPVYETRDVEIIAFM